MKTNKTNRLFVFVVAIALWVAGVACGGSGGVVCTAQNAPTTTAGAELASALTGNIPCP